MRIAIVTDHFLPKSDGIVTRICATIDYFKQAGHEVELYTIGNSEICRSGIKVHTYRAYKLPYCASRKISTPNFHSIFHQLDTYKPDIVHIINATMLSFPAYYYCWRRSCPLIGSVHTDYLTYLDYYRMRALKPLVRQMIRAFCRFNRLTLCSSNHYQSKLQALGVTPLSIWQKGVDTERFHPQKFSASMRAHLSQGDTSSPLLIYGGRLSPEKNLSCLRVLFHTLPNVRLAFIGKGSSRSTLEKEFMNTPTFFAGDLHGEDLAKAYASADVFVMPSMSETLGLAALEAMAAGCPVVAADAGGLQEVVNHGENGFLIDPTNNASMVNAVSRLVTERQLRDQFSSRARVEAEKWDWKQSAARLLESYHSILTSVY